jgi:hypothetical protein
MSFSGPKKSSDAPNTGTERMADHKPATQLASVLHKPTTTAGGDELRRSTSEMLEAQDHDRVKGEDILCSPI